MKLLDICTIILLVAIFILFAFCNKEKKYYEWHYDGDPKHEGRYIIRFESGVSMPSDFYGGEWHYIDGGILEKKEVDCWREID